MIDVSWVEPATVFFKLNSFLSCSDGHFETVDALAKPFTIRKDKIWIRNGHIKGCCKLGVRFFSSEYYYPSSLYFW